MLHCSYADGNIQHVIVLTNVLKRWCLVLSVLKWWSLVLTKLGMQCTSVGPWPNMREVKVEKKRERERAKWVRVKRAPSTFLLSHFTRKVGREVFTISLGGACIYKRTYMSYKWALSIFSQALWLCNWELKTLMRSLTYSTSPTLAPKLFGFDQRPNS